VNRDVRVWAPRPSAVTLLVDGNPRPMVQHDRGWWRADVDCVDEGTRYAFSLDGGPARADPRSARQPDGVLGPAAFVDHGAFAWSDAAWRSPPLSSFVIYELHIGTFTQTGTFDAAIEHLDHLVDLGVTAVEVMPIASFPGRHGWGYDGVHLYAPHEPYGGPDGFKRFVDACHGTGLAVVLDVVYNHLGPLGNHLAEFGPYFTSEATTPWGDAVNLDGDGSDEVRRFFIDNALMWLRDYHVDGLRLDAVHALHDSSDDPFLAQLAREVHALDGDKVVTAEANPLDPRLITEMGLDAVWNDDVHHNIHVALTGERDGYYAPFDGTANELARVLAPPFGADRAVVFAQNHDQIGNRALGDRLGQLVDADAVRAAAATVLLSPSIPLLFQGEEWSASTPFQYFTDHPDPDLAEAVRRGRRAEFAAFGWPEDAVPDPQDPATRDRSVLRWDERTDPHHAAILDWYRDLIRLRRRRLRGEAVR
jgi:maltooligosyltrehalose trehalohydrolase